MSIWEGELPAEDRLGDIRTCPRCLARRLVLEQGGSAAAKDGRGCAHPNLSGLGDRAHLADLLEPAQVNLDLHIRDVPRLLEYESLSDVVLVGHAMPAW